MVLCALRACLDSAVHQCAEASAVRPRLCAICLLYVLIHRPAWPRSIAPHDRPTAC